MSDSPAKKISNDRIPQHVAIIMDGNGRWAKERGKPRIDGHKQGAKQISKVLKAAEKCGVKILTLYAFSSENWNRPREEVDALMSLLSAAIRENRKSFIDNEIRFRTIGDIDALPANCVKDIEELEKTTKRFKKQTLVLALNYGSRDELIRAVSKIAHQALDGKINPNKICWKNISDNLDTADIPDPDLLIRTSGEMRLSNYLLLQAAYAELYFTKTYWPDFGEKEFIEAVEEYQNRERRYGLTGEQIK